MGSEKCFSMPGRWRERLSRADLAPFALTANIHLYGDQGSPYDVRIAHSDCDFREEDSESIATTSESPDLYQKF